MLISRLNTETRIGCKINGLVHFSFPKRVAKLLVLHSYITDTISKKSYHIDLFYENIKIDLAYDDRKAWEEILEHLNDMI